MPNHVTSEFLTSQRLSLDFMDRFFEKVMPVTYDGGCHLWVGAISGNGYGSIARGSPFKDRIAAHTASFIINRGPVPEGMWVLHNCPNGDNRACVNPNHLWAGTVFQNNHDMYIKGRSTFGERSGQSKLTWNQVVEIRRLGNNGVSSYEIAHRFGVKVFCIYKILSGRRWNNPHLFNA